MELDSSSSTRDATLVSALVQSKKRAYSDYGASYLAAVPDLDNAPDAARELIASKIALEWAPTKEIPMTDAMKAAARSSAPAAAAPPSKRTTGANAPELLAIEDAASDPDPAPTAPSADVPSSVVQRTLESRTAEAAAAAEAASSFARVGAMQLALVQGERAPTLGRPTWHAPWRLMRVISGHLGWVRCCTVDVSNDFFVTGAADRTIKIWDLASGTLRLTLTGHISTVRGVAMSDRHPYLFSAGEDKKVLCWDLECNRVVRHYHGHMSGVYGIAVHPGLDVIVTCGRDASARVWDMRTKAEIFSLAGHQGTVNDVLCQSAEPQIITGSADTTIRLWDLRAGKTLQSLTHHKKGVRGLAAHPREYTFLSGAADNIKHWKLPEGRFIKNISGHHSVVNDLAVNRDDVVVSGGDNGSMRFYDYKTGYCFQDTQARVQSGSLECESGIFALTFDRTGSRLISCEADKTIKIYREDPTASEETHPLDLSGWNPNAIRR